MLSIVPLVVLLATCEAPLGGTPIGGTINIYKAECLNCNTAELMLRCADGIDNDEDRLLDCEDPDCSAYSACNVVVGPEVTAELCADGFDNDNDSYTDCDDHDCTETLACRPANPEPENVDQACYDGLDNDHDGRIDCRDTDCLTAAVTVCEGTDAACSDGIDNDENGFTDCNDFSCSQNDNVTICN